jgi:transposase
MKTYSRDLRERIVRERELGKSAAEVARQFRVCKRTVERYWKRHRESGACNVLPCGGHRVSRLAGHLETVREWIAAQPDLTLAELCARLLSTLRIAIGKSTLAYHLARLGLSYKKNGFRRRARARRRASSPSRVAPKAARDGGQTPRLP